MTNPSPLPVARETILVDGEELPESARLTVPTEPNAPYIEFMDELVGDPPAPRRQRLLPGQRIEVWFPSAYYGPPSTHYAQGPPQYANIVEGGNHCPYCGRETP